MDDIVGTYDGIDLTPFDPLSRLRGESSLGTWELRVNDSAGANEGQVNGWSLDVCGRAFETSPPEMRFREVRVETDGVRLDWWPYPGMLSYRVYRSTDSSTASAFVDVTGEDPDGTDTVFKDGSSEPLVYWLVTAVGPGGESPKGHFGQ